MTVDINTLYRDNYTKQLRMLQRMLHGDLTRAEDVLSEAYLRAVRYQGSYRTSKASVQTWFNSIMFNTLRDELKSTQINDPLRENEEEEVDFLKKPENYKLIEEKIHKYTDSEPKQFILYCFYILGYTSTDITQIVPCTSVTQVTTTCSRFKIWLKEEI